MGETTPKGLLRVQEKVLWVALAAIAAWVVARAPLAVAAAGFGAASLVVGTIVWPPVVLPAVAIAVPFGPAISLGDFAVGSTDLLVGLGIAVWLTRHWARREWPPLKGVFLPPLFLYLAALLLSLHAAWSLRAALPELVKWLEIAAFYALVATMLRSYGGRVAVLAVAAFAVAAVAEAVLGLVQFLLGLGPPGFVILGRFMRAYGTFAQPNPYAGYLGLVFPVVLSLAVHHLSELPRSAWRLSHLWRSGRAFTLWASAAGVIALGLFASWSRAGWVGMAAATIAVLVLRSRRSIIWLGAGAVSGLSVAVLGITGGLPPSIAQRFSGLENWTLFLRPEVLRTIPVTSANFALIERMAHWWAAWAMWLDHPLTGVGVGNYPVAYAAYRLPGWEDPLGHAHNILLNALAETGMVGLLTYLLLWGMVFAWLLAQIRSTAGFRRALLLGVLGSLTHLTVHNLFDNLYVHGMYAYVAMLLALGEWAATSGEDDTNLSGRQNSNHVEAA